MSLTPRLDKLDRNYIINGNFDFWQRRTSLSAGPATAGGNYVADRFRGDFGSVTNSTIVFSRSTDVPNLGSTYSHLTTVSSAGTLGTTSYLLPCYQYIEGNFFQKIHRKSVTLSFFVKCSMTGTFPVTFRNGASDRSYVTTFTVNAANTWEKKVITVTLDQSGTWYLNTAIGLGVFIGSFTGSTFHAPSADTWHSGNYLSLPTCTNWFTNGSTMNFSQIQLVEGTHEDPEFTTAGRNYKEELELCERYYQRFFTLARGWSDSTTNVRFHVDTGVRFRVDPIPSLISGASLTGALDEFGISGAVDAISFVALSCGSNCVRFNLTMAPRTQFRMYALNNDIVQADAEL